MRQITLFAWMSVAAAVIAWGAFAMFAWNILSQEREIQSREMDTEALGARESAALRLHALARDTKKARTELDDLTRSEVLTVADIIEGVGKSAGLKVKIGGATSESSVEKSDGVPSLRAINFQVDAEGAFSAVMHAAALFENLPVLSSVENLELARVDSGENSAKTKPPLWRLSARIQVITADDTSI